MNSPDPASISFNPTPLAVAAEVLKGIIPGAVLVNDPTRMGFLVEFRLRMNAPIEMLPSPESAVHEMVLLAEQFRTRALRELGLDTILEAQKREVIHYAETAQMLSDRVTAQARRISDLEAALDLSLAEDNPDD